MTNLTEPMAYVGRAACGCVVAVTVDDPIFTRQTAKEVGKWIRSGLNVERMTVEAARPLITRCPHKESK